MKIRYRDRWGAGHFGASRGDRLHMGVDVICAAGDTVFSVSGGEVTKLGYCYSDDLSFRYVQMTDSEGARWRYFYVNPSCGVGDRIEAYSELGSSQCLTERYPGITQHYHLEIIKADGEYINPTGFVKDF